MKSNPNCTLAHCPDENEIMAMTMGLLSEDEVTRLERVLDQCSFCSELVAALAQDLEPSDDADEGFRNGQKQPTRVGKYEIKDLLGVGGMGMIYEAIDRELQRPVALKLLRPDVVDPERRKAHTKRLLREAQLLAALRHPNIPVVYEVGTWHEQVFMAVQLIDGMNMRQWLAHREASWSELVEMYCQAGEGMIAAHDAGIVHRDIKPDNIMVSSQPPEGTSPDDTDSTAAPRVWITDFGLARWVQSSYHSTSIVEALEPAIMGQPLGLTGLGELLGTPAYMAPEQHKGQGVSHRSDQFSFCVSLYEALYGMRPFEGRNMDELASSAQRGEIFVPYNSKVPHSIFHVLRKGMHPIPNERYASMTALLSALRNTASHAQKAPNQHVLRRLVIAVAILLFGAGNFWLGRMSVRFGTKSTANAKLTANAKATQPRKRATRRIKAKPTRTRGGPFKTRRIPLPTRRTTPKTTRKREPNKNLFNALVGQGFEPGSSDNKDPSLTRSKIRPSKKKIPFFKKRPRRRRFRKRRRRWIPKKLRGRRNTNKPPNRR